MPTMPDLLKNNIRNFQKLSGEILKTQDNIRRNNEAARKEGERVRAEKEAQNR